MYSMQLVDSSLPLEGPPIACKLCPPCRERLRLGDRRLMELVETRLLLIATVTSAVASRTFDSIAPTSQDWD